MRQALDKDRGSLPRHIAIIMDGNGRWAKQHTLGRIAGHREGAESVRVAVRECRRIGIRYLTLYAFSMENWSRPKREVEALQALLDQYLQKEVPEMLKNGIRLLTIGDTARLKPSVRETLAQAVEATACNDDMTLVLALSYGGRDEIAEAAQRIAADVKHGDLQPGDITKERFASYLYTADIPDPDLLIRTSGEYRLSNFLLWQMAYTEFHFTDVLWPDFREEQLRKAIEDYRRRERRFGRTSDQLRKD
ncbi:MAG: Ditrans,polycis-undecaprenyl-diphosphate synthase ((2E,6E)-farnesyl-diphosphate specific) [Syntrophaceae bacterium PtaU1.Bin231]|nr:MAG: Ditrans,polycis-undecaprenyl-diphosphate synthase ((2E,6E)-farnesyl-diphosphate specific) [Syntrophaceae bacterium PtaU1.Bin231]